VRSNGLITSMYVYKRGPAYVCICLRMETRKKETANRTSIKFLIQINSEYTNLLFVRQYAGRFVKKSISTKIKKKTFKKQRCKLITIIIF